MRRTETAREADVLPRLAVIENKLETVLSELKAIRGLVPEKIVEHTERMVAMERGLRGLQWTAGVFAVAIVGAFIGHIFGR
ncbi:MAG: hypothetical protein Q7T82_18185 [Armatimonadota bacterium]|nr:hypothetical protein [Armatimonadota bacterium]